MNLFNQNNVLYNNKFHAYFSSSNACEAKMRVSHTECVRVGKSELLKRESKWNKYCNREAMKDYRVHWSRRHCHIHTLSHLAADAMICQSQLIYIIIV